MNSRIDSSEIDKLCKMSALEFGDEDKITLISEVNSIKSMLDKLGEVEDEQLFLNTQKLGDLREDEVCDGMSESEVFLNAPRSSNGYFIVPKVVD